MDFKFGLIDFLIYISFTSAERMDDQQLRDVATICRRMQFFVFLVAQCPHKGKGPRHIMHTN